MALSAIDEALVRRYDVNAPRYTSYPTAAQFSAAVGPAEWSAWLARTRGDQPVSLYVHLPFCKRLCWYCGCNTRAVNRREVISSYLDLLLAEADLVVDAAGGPLRVETLHLGGGTPNMLTPNELDGLIAGLRQRFDMTSLTEFAAELDPEVLTPEWIAAAGELGLTRASLGVQDLSPDVQAAVNRPESFESIAAAAKALRQAGVTSLNLDVMYGLPLQGVDQVLATLTQVATLRPERIALFGYAHVPWMKPHQKLIKDAHLPGPRARFAQSRAAEAFLIEAGYEAIGLDHFALPHDGMAIAHHSGRLRRNFQGYTTDLAETLVGLGASSISRTPDGYAQNATLERDWRAAIQSRRLATARGVALSDEDALLADIIERLMCEFAVDLGAVYAKHGRPYPANASAPNLSEFESDGLVTRRGDLVTVTDRGRPFVRAVCAAFDPKLETSPGRHARVV
ncbi:oxygen-independent coproporphyrinogen III oxidase [Brevundimonas sp. 2R-24]|uniref:Coproporphyrinogen-III oxidase n=1 Tax=Peiella sedimenti TaxID=3061083 RepID=A0ABT8SJ38_9CAUL|nr:oxygen-independent coproporphyrinogen III oxidase [Caulobacteraceae bacterium XZ-24]